MTSHSEQSQGSLPEDTMPAKTLQALHGSIAKWENVVSTGARGTRWIDCPLCLLFFEAVGDDCKGCPVAAKTGKPACKRSPYTKYVRLYNDSNSADPGKDPLVMAAAKEELEFLKSLLPKEAA